MKATITKLEHVPVLSLGLPDSGRRKFRLCLDVECNRREAALLELTQTGERRITSMGFARDLIAHTNKEGRIDDV